MSADPFVQVAIDCEDPHLLARFWADGFDYEVENHESQIRHLLAEGFVTDDDVTERDGTLVWKTAAACRHAAPGLPRLLFQVVPEPKTIKNRVHLDFHVADRDRTLERLLGLGATRLGEGRQGPHTWVVMADPEGNEFCVS